MKDNLHDWLRSFTRPMRGHPKQLILDGFSADFFLKFDVEEDQETPESIGTCDIAIVPLMAADQLADAIHLVSNANKYGVLRLLSALGVQRFNEKTKKAFYGSFSVLRTMPVRTLSEKGDPTP